MKSEPMPPGRVPMIWRISPTASELEEEVAAIIESAIWTHDGRKTGERTRRDGRDDSGLRVDFTYEAAEPPIAMEVTGSPEPSVRALGSELSKLERELREVVASEGLGRWRLAIWVGASARKLRGMLVELFRSQRERPPGTTFSRQEAPADLGSSDRILLDDLLGAGLFMASIEAGDNDVGVFPPVADTSPLGGFAGLLEQAMRENIDKLREAKPRQTHLAVTIDRPASSDPARTPPVRLIEGLDYLWAMLGWWNAKETYRLWRIAGRDAKWLMMMHPFGAPARLHPPA